MSARASLLLALHSSSDCLAVGLQPLAATEPPQVRAFPLGRQLSGALLPCLEQLLPAPRWSELGRLVVATGPGGFTSTRLTVVLARTLAQQLAVPLQGVGSFLAVARRLVRQRPELAGAERFWLVQDLPRRGTVAGCYGADPAALGALAELEQPRLRTVRSRLQHLRQESRRMAQLYHRLQRRIQAQEAEALWLQDIRSMRPGPDPPS